MILNKNFSTLVSAYLIHAKSYRDTSLLVDFFTKDHGFIKAVAQGIRSPNKNNIRGILQPFTPLLINWRQKSNLSTLINLNTIELADQPYVFKNNQLAIGFYINELLYYLCAKSPGIVFDKLYDNYNRLLKIINNSQLASSSNIKLETNLEITLREFELDLLTSLGYGLQFNNITAELTYGYDFNNGFFVIDAEKMKNSLSLPGDLLINIMRRDWQIAETLLLAKKLNRNIIKYYIGNKDLQSRKLYITNSDDT